MVETIKFVWCGIATLEAAQKILNDVYKHQDFLDSPPFARTFTRRFVAFVKHSPTSLIRGKGSTLITISETDPKLRIGFFLHNAKTQEVHLTISYDDIK